MDGGVEPRKWNILQRYSHYTNSRHIELRWSRRPEVRLVNRYAVILGYLKKAMTALSYLVILWCTVVLLGGFVTSLTKKDFWCLAVIILIHSAGVFTAWSDEQFVHLRWWVPSFDGYVGDLTRYLLESGSSSAAFIIALKLVDVIFGIACFIVLLTLSAVYMHGWYFSLVIPLVRLMQHDYGIAEHDTTKSNLEPALTLLYCIAIVQGILYLMFCIFGCLQGILVRVVGEHYEIHGGWGYQSILRYVVLTTKRCFRDPLFAKGWNLITFAVAMLESETPEVFHRGAWLLDKLIKEHEQHFSELIVEQERHLKDLTKEQKQQYVDKREECRLHVMLNWVPRSSYTFMLPRYRPSAQDELLKKMGDMFIEKKQLKMKLIESKSYENIVQALLRKLGQRSTCKVDTRECIAKIVAYIADDIHLEQFPREIQCISSLLETSEQDWHRNAEAEAPLSPTQSRSSEAQNGESTNGDAAAGASINTQYMNLMLQGLCIFEKLASNDDNCRVMSNNRCLLSKIMVPVSSDLLHRIDDGSWFDIVMGSLRVMRRLIAAPEETGRKLRGEIASNREAISSMQGILRCGTCGLELELQKLALEILTQLFMDKSSRMDPASKGSSAEMLLHMFTDENNDSSIRKLAGEALAKVSLTSVSHCMIILQVNDDVADSLTKIILQDENNTYRIIAAQILEGLCIHYTKNDDYGKRLHKTMIDVMPQVFREILRCGSRREEIQTEIEANGVELSTEAIDIENQYGISEDNERSNNTSSSQQNDEEPEDGKLKAVMSSLCVNVFDDLINEAQDLSILSKAISAGDTAFSFPVMLTEVVKKNSQPTPNSLRIMKLTSQMVISMMKHRGGFMQEHLEGLMESLSSASKLMVELDVFMLFSSGDVAATKPVRTLTSLVKEAEQLMDKNRMN